MVQLSHLYMTIGKTIALTRQTFVSKVMSLLFYAVYVGHSFSSKEQVSFNLMAAVTICSILETKKKKALTVSHLIRHEVMGLAMILLMP